MKLLLTFQYNQSEILGTLGNYHPKNIESFKWAVRKLQLGSETSQIRWNPILTQQSYGKWNFEYDLILSQRTMKMRKKDLNNPGFNFQSEHFSFLGSNVAISEMRCRSMFYTSLGRLLMVDLGEDEERFYNFMLPLTSKCIS